MAGGGMSRCARWSTRCTATRTGTPRPLTLSRRDHHRTGSPPRPGSSLSTMTRGGASCSIPGWYEPVVIDGRRYVDGGVRSATSLGVMAGAGVDEVYVLAPMASVETDRPRKPHERVERRLRWLFTLALMREANALRSLGIKVTVITPGPEDLAVMGANLMNPRRRTVVLDTSLRTSAAVLASTATGDDLAGGVPKVA